MAEQPPPTEHTAPTSHPTTTVNGHPRAHSAEEEAEAAETAETAGSIDSPSHGISINLPDLVTGDQPVRPQPIKRMSAPTTPQISPIRQHKRAPSKSRPVKETLDAHSYYGSGDDDGAAVHRINQYIIKQEIGRGSFGAVHLAVDQYGGEYAVKEFSKSRLRKRAQSNLLRRPQDSNQRRRSGHLAAGLGFNSPLFRLSSSEKLRQEQQQQQQQHQQHGDQPTESSNNSLELIKQEIAIMKKLNHPNLVALLEVLDDPQEDSLYMVLEMCKKGVVMQVGLDERADPYPDDICRTWFRDMILGIEYLHAHGIIHRDIKPDNCLITSDDVLKIVDFGVSEMFAKDQDMATTKSAGSPAFMPPELCVARHGPREGLLELYESIRADEVPLEEEGDAGFADMMRKLLEKDPERRMTMAELREHPWVTESGTDPLLPASENCAELVDPPTEGEVANAITGNMAHLMIVMKAVKRFKEILHRKRPSSVQGLFGRSSRVVAPPGTIGGSQVRSGRSQEREKATPQSSSGGQQDDVANADFGNESERQQHRAQGMEPGIEQRELAAKDHEPETNKDERRTTHHENDQRTPRAEDHAKGHAHDPLTDTLFLDVGPGGAYVLEGEEGGEELDHGGVGTEMENSAPQHVISESPPEVATNIYETAYQEEIKRILSEREKGDGEEKGNGDGEEGEGAAGGLGIHLNRRVDHRGDIRGMLGLRASKGGSTAKDKLSGLLGGGSSGGGFARLVQKAKEQSGIEGGEARDAKPESSEDSEEAPLQPPRLDGAGGGEAERTDGEEEESQMGQGVPATSVKAHAQAQAQVDVQAHLDAASGAMPDVPGGFPASTGLGSQTAGDGKGTR